MMSSSKILVANTSGGGTTDVDFPDQLKCPICVEVPEAEIYQCKNGHVICNKCKDQLTVGRCPQCRVAFEVDGGDLIRNRVLESLVKSVVVPCPFRHNGCSRNFSLKKIKNHSVNCEHNDKRIQLCKLLGYNCDFWTNPLKVSSTVGHFHSHHKAHLLHSDFVHLKIHNFVESIKDMKTFNAIWKPVILYNDNTTVMVLTLLKPKSNFVSWIFLNLTPEVCIQSRTDFSGGFKAKLTLKNNDFSCPSLIVHLPVVSVLKSAEVIGKPLFRLRIKTLEGRYLDASEILNVFISLKKGTKENKEIFVYLRKITPIIKCFVSGDDQKEEEEESFVNNLWYNK